MEHGHLPTRADNLLLRYEMYIGNVTFLVPGTSFTMVTRTLGLSDGLYPRF